LKPWPDSVPGLARLKKKFIIAPLSNGNISLLTNMAKFSGLPWDLILSAELAQHYKPDAEAYLTAIELLGLQPRETMMVAAHSNDLKAARECGMLTGFVYRPDEFGSVRAADSAGTGEFDLVAGDMGELASLLGA
jgi:2-haloacid dehalogenase